MNDEVQIIANLCEEKGFLIPRSDDENHYKGLAVEYYYNSLPFCVIDSIFSIGVRYSSVRQTVMQYCAKYGLTRIRPYFDKDKVPERNTQQSMDDFLRLIRGVKSEELANEIFKNRQRTSSKAGILKAEAVIKFSEILQKYGIIHLQDVPTILFDNNFENEIKTIPGQRSGISLKYFFMLSGDENTIKPDRMILRFIGNEISRTPSLDEAQILLSHVVSKLRAKAPFLTARYLDYQIWDYQRKL